MALRDRSAQSARTRGSDKRSLILPLTRRKVAAATRWVVEALEDRTLLTTLHGGDTFVFFGEQSTNLPFVPQYQTITLRGNITAELVGANVDGTNTVQLENLPGQLNGADINGGFALPAGATPVATIPGTPNPVQAIAVDPTTGIMYGTSIETVQVPPVPPSTTPTTRNLVHLFSINKSTGATTDIAEISDAILGASGIQVGPRNTQLVTAISAMTFVDGTLYMAAAIGGGGNQHLVFLNPGNPNSVGGAQGTFGGQNVVALTAVTNASGQTNLYGASKTAIFSVNTGNSNNIQNLTTLNVNGDISGITQASNGKIYATTSNGGPDSEVYWVNPVATTADGSTGGDAIDYGPLPSTAVVNNVLRATSNTGQNPGTMTFDPTTNQIFSFDTTTHQLFIVSQANRTRALSVFQLYVSQSDPTGQIITSQSNTALTEGGANGFMTPYGTGLTGALRVFNIQTGRVNIIAAPAGSGTAIIGARTRHVIPNATNDTLVPLTTGVVPNVAVTGTPASPFTTAPYTVGTTVTAGVVSAPGTSIGEILDSGPLMGEVHLAGSIDTLYAGWLLTGTAGGEGATNTVSDPGNFSVAGDIRNLLVSDSIGTDSDSALYRPTYVTGFDMHVTGTIGRVQTFDSLIGNVNDAHSPTAQNLTTNYTETEQRTAGNNDPWASGLLSGNTFFNDTFATAQVVGALPTAVNAAASAVVLDGVLDADPLQHDYVDYYGVALLAGQTVTCQVVSTPLPGQPIDLGVFNSDGTLIASDYNKVAPVFTQQKQFRFTADRPGVYRFAVANTGNATFTTAGGSNVGDIPYELTIQNVGNIAVGGILATNNILDNVQQTKPEASFGAEVGDFGILSAGNDIMSTNAGNTVNVLTGNLRGITAGSLGLTGPAPFDSEIQVPHGSVGLIQSTSTSGVLQFNLQGSTAPAIGGDFQVVSSASDFNADLIADGSIGVLRAAQMTIGPSIFHVNAGNSTTPGNIDLIDVTGDFGAAGIGGPQITTGPMGNVGFIRVGGDVYRDATFGAPEQVESTIYQPGESVTFTDDSGAQVVVTPTGTPSIAATGGPTAGTGGTIVNPNLPQLTVTAYGIEGSGGVVLVNVTSTGGVTFTGSGQENGQTVQIGVIDAQGLGQTINQVATSPTKVTQPQPPSPTGTTGGTTTTTTTTPTFFTAPDTAGPQGRTLPLPNPPILDPNSASPLDVILTGTARMDAFEVDGGLFSSITNSSGGDIVNVNAKSIGTLSSNGQIGLTQNHTGADLLGMKVVANTFPLIDIHNAITVGVAGGVTPGGKGPVNPITTTTVLNGTTTTTTTAVVTTPVVSTTPSLGIANLIAPHGIGNVNCIDGASIGTIQGSILGPVYVSGSIFSVVLSAGGIAANGTGANTRAGIYSVGQLGLVTNSVPCDIRGVIASSTGMTGISLKNGSLIFAEIENVTDFADTVQIPSPLVVVPNRSPVTNPVLDMGNIVVDGNGGIIGTTIIGAHIGQIDVHRGFGFLSNSIGTVPDGTLAGIVADGYGIRGLAYTGSAVGQVIAGGDGRSVSTQLYSPDVRLSEVNQFDPYSGFQPNPLTDIDAVTGATAQLPQTPGNGVTGTDTGVIADVYFYGNRTLGTVRGFQIRSTDPVNAPCTFNFANSIGTVRSLSNDDGISLITGRLKTFAPGGNVDHLTFQIAGTIGNLNIAGNVTSDSVIAATGRNGNIGNLRVGGTLQGSITASRRINSATIGGNLTGTVSAKQINSLKVFGMLNGGNLDVQGNVNNIQFLGDLGLPGETLTIHGSVRTLKIGGNLNCDLVVQGNLGTLQVSQSVMSDTLTDVSGVINLLRVDGDIQAGATIQAKLIRHQKISGQVLGTVA